jgi:hypothetical protein
MVLINFLRPRNKNWSIKVVAFFFFIPFFMGCETEPEHVKLAHRFRAQFINYAQKKHHLVCFGEGGGLMNQINEFDLYFYASGEKSIDELRMLMAFVINDFLSQINSNEQIKPFLAEYPFPANRLTLSIALLGDDRKPIINNGNETTLITNVFLLKGKLYYHTRNEKKYQPKHKQVETYEEAYNIVNEHGKVDLI